MTTREQAEALSGYIGRTVTVCFWDRGVSRYTTNILDMVCGLENVIVGRVGLPFVGRGCAIRKIWESNTSKLLYHNPLILPYYDMYNDEELEHIAAETFGQDVADARRQVRLREQREYEDMVTRTNMEAKSKGPGLREAGVALVRPEKKQAWRLLADLNTRDGYSCAIVPAVVAGMQALTDGKTVQEAEVACTATEEGLSGNQMGYCAETISSFHPRGDEFCHYWNRKFLDEEKVKVADESGAVVNPAILNIKEG